MSSDDELLQREREQMSLDAADLKHQIECLESHPQLEIILTSEELELLQGRLGDLKWLFEITSPTQTKPIDGVLSDIRHLILSFTSGRDPTRSALLKVTEEIGWFTDCYMMAEEDEDREEDREQSYAGKKKTMVGMENEAMGLKDFLCMDDEFGLGVQFVVGMAGIGKTSLVRQAYHDSPVIARFHKRLFLPIGPQSNLKEILLLALRQLRAHIDEKLDENSLGATLRKYLLYRRYLIVLDDLWDVEIFNQLSRFLPNNQSNSRIILTSRMQDVSSGLTYSLMRTPDVQMRFMDDEESWILLHDTVFTSDEPCCPQLEKVGKKIAKKCEGLPLAIIQVGHLLRKTEKTVAEWKTIEEKEDPITISRDDNTPLSEALYLSYGMLPQHLKVCFLYMGVFPKHYEIRRTKLITLWVAERILEPQEGSSLEQIAHACLAQLVSHSVVLEMESRSLGKSGTKTCRLHFTFRNLCASEAKIEKLYPIMNKYTDSLPEDMDGQERLCIHNNVLLSIEQVNSWMESVPDARSLLCLGPKQQYPIELHLPFGRLKVLEALAMRFYEFPHQALELVHLTYLSITCDGELPPFISSLPKLEVLIVHQHHIIKTPNVPVYLPTEIWSLLELKRLQCVGSELPEPPPNDALILRKLLTLSGVSAHSCTQGVLARMPNLVKLGIRVESAHDAVENFSFLGNFASVYEEFVSFKCVVVNPNLTSPAVPSILCFPVNILKITLSGCGLPWEHISAIATLPNLRALKLRWYAFCGPEWKIGLGEFPRLDFLLLEDLDLEHWDWEDGGDTDIIMPARLIVRHCYKLKMFPYKIEEPSKWIDVEDCTTSLARFARVIQDEHTYTSTRVHCSWEDKKSRSYAL